MTVYCFCNEFKHIFSDKAYCLLGQQKHLDNRIPSTCLVLKGSNLKNTENTSTSFEIRYIIDYQY